MRKIKILIVDDSLMMRELLTRGIREDQNLEVVAAVRDPFEARDAIIKYEPDVMVLDIELPRMNGIEFLKKLMPQYPLPVVMLSAMNDRVFDAMQAGAVDFVKKPVGMDMKMLEAFVRQELIVKIKIASTVKVGSLKKVSMKPTEELKGHSMDTLIAIGASTGGTEAIFNVIKQFGKNIPGIVVVQHMPLGFTDMYARRLNEQCRILAKEAQTGDRVLPGQVLVAPGDRQMKVIALNGGYQVECKGTEKVSGHCPSVNVLFESVAKAAGKHAIGVLLTGMGEDGAKGLLKMKGAGAKTIGQNEESCVVYGMPKVAYEMGAVMYQTRLEDIPGRIYSILNQNSR